MKSKSQRSVQTKRTNCSYGGLVKLAAQISGRSISTVYGVLYGRVHSARVSEAIKKAKRQLGRDKKVA